MCVLYVPPNANDLYHQHLLDVLHFLPPNKDLMIIGDFNLPDIDWDVLNGESRQSTNFCELIVHLIYVN